MPSWIPRALGMAVLHAAATVAAAKFAVFQPTEVTLVTVIALAVLVGTAALWSAIDSWTGLAEAGRAWFVAALVGGVGSGVLTVVGKAVFVDRTGVSALASALTGGAAFTALLVLVPAGLGLLVGRRLRATQGPGDDSGEPDEPRDEPRDETAPWRPSPRPRRRDRQDAEPAR
nr:B-4DMT family transporter [Saccharomonospora piscinae]